MLQLRLWHPRPRAICGSDETVRLLGANGGRDAQAEDQTERAQTGTWAEQQNYMLNQKNLELKHYRSNVLFKSLLQFTSPFFQKRILLIKFFLKTTSCGNF